MLDSWTHTAATPWSNPVHEIRMTAFSPPKSPSLRPRAASGNGPGLISHAIRMPMRNFPPASGPRPPADPYSPVYHRTRNMTTKSLAGKQFDAATSCRFSIYGAPDYPLPRGSARGFTPGEDEAAPTGLFPLTLALSQREREFWVGFHRSLRRDSNRRTEKKYAFVG